MLLLWLLEKQLRHGASMSTGKGSGVFLPCNPFDEAVLITTHGRSPWSRVLLVTVVCFMSTLQEQALWQTEGGVSVAVAVAAICAFVPLPPIQVHELYAFHAMQYIYKLVYPQRLI